MTYQRVTGPLMANSHPGSYCGQDAYNDMLVVEDGSMYRNRSNRRSYVPDRSMQDFELYARTNENFEGGCDMKPKLRVRRLTWKECTRLQGFPDDWLDIGDWVDSKRKKHKDADGPKYQALGNSIAVGYANHKSGFWCNLLKRISAEYESDATLGSLFDGIGGFPLAWEAYNGKGSARWASEIEEFCIAVTKKHFPEEE